MAIDTDHLRTLYWIARLGSFRAAAERLNVSQPTISFRIKTWESELGCTLFERRGRTMRLTEDGAAALDYAERILSLMEDLDRRLSGDSDLKGQIRLGVPDSFAIVGLPTLVKALEDEHPSLKVALTIADSAVLGARLDEGALDVAVLSQPRPRANVHLKTLGRHRLLWVSAPGLLPAHARYQPTDLAETRIFTNPSPSPSFQLLMNWFDEYQTVPRRLCTCDSLSVVRSLVLAGLGISALPHSFVQHELAGGTLVALDVAPDLAAPEIFLGTPRRTRNAAIFVMERLLREVIEETAFLDVT
ncbi:LysR family transcriptional regulator [Acuticoccus sp. M5D2P5]|uniref:LysR family transcriptional regulator n=1 Tax=Acuticoccus kalidii TaxID=2910977 RepID=UPI001F3EBA06|nr:LysR family transcriptional regulator [Acuticoccus kalidii]MCF3933722.1 LysR family transcriptional regulator [Acuticoccus kalidii]